MPVSVTSISFLQLLASKKAKTKWSIVSLFIPIFITQVLPDREEKFPLYFIVTLFHIS